MKTPFCPSCNEPLPDVFVPYSAVKDLKPSSRPIPLAIVYCDYCHQILTVKAITREGHVEFLDTYLPTSEISEIVDAAKVKASAEQREICEKIGKHHKFGWYRYKKGEMLNAPKPVI